MKDPKFDETVPFTTPEARDAHDKMLHHPARATSADRWTLGFDPADGSDCTGIVVLNGDPAADRACFERAWKKGEPDR